MNVVMRRSSGVGGDYHTADLSQPRVRGALMPQSDPAPETKEVALRYARLVNLAASAICAVTKPRPKSEACRTVSIALSSAAIGAWDKERIRGEEDPSGYKQEELKGGFTAEFDADSRLLMFSLHPPLERSVQ